MRAVPSLEKVKGDNDDIQTGINIVKRALEEPLRQIANNSGAEGSVIVNEARTRKKTEGFDAYEMKWVDMFDAGIIDPTKVARCALQNAASIAALMLTTEALIHEIPEEEKKAPAMPHGGGMY